MLTKSGCNRHLKKQDSGQNQHELYIKNLLNGQTIEEKSLKV